MGLHKKTFVIGGDLKLFKQILVLIRRNSGSENKQVRMDTYREPEHMVGYRQFQFFCFARSHFRQFVEIIPDKNDPFFPGLFVQIFPEAIRPDIPVNNIHPIS